MSSASTYFTVVLVSLVGRRVDARLLQLKGAPTRQERNYFSTTVSSTTASETSTSVTETSGTPSPLPPPHPHPNRQWITSTPTSTVTATPTSTISTTATTTPTSTVISTRIKRRGANDGVFCKGSTVRVHDRVRGEPRNLPHIHRTLSVIMELEWRKILNHHTVCVVATHNPCCACCAHQRQLCTVRTDATSYSPRHLF